MLCFPHRYLDMMSGFPSNPRPLHPVIRQKKLAYLEVAKILLQKHPTESTARAVRFLMSICNNDEPQAVPRLDWFEKPPSEGAVVDLRLPQTLCKLAPLMRFNAQLRRWEENQLIIKRLHTLSWFGSPGCAAITWSSLHSIGIWFFAVFCTVAPAVLAFVIPSALYPFCFLEDICLKHLLAEPLIKWQVGHNIPKQSASWTYHPSHECALLGPWVMRPALHC